MTPACVYSDGCVLWDNPRVVPNGPRGYGGWAAVVEDGHSGRVVRGHEPDATSTRMELRAALEGLRAVEATDRHVLLHTDCTTILSVYDRWERAAPLDRRAGARAPDADLWVALGDQLDRLHVEVKLVRKCDDVKPHRRAHLMSREEACVEAGRATPEALRAWQRRRSHAERGALPPVRVGYSPHVRHLRGCSPQHGCAIGCPVVA